VEEGLRQETVTQTQGEYSFWSIADERPFTTAVSTGRCNDRVIVGSVRMIAYGRKQPIKLHRGISNPASGGRDGFYRKYLPACSRAGRRGRESHRPRTWRVSRIQRNSRKLGNGCLGKRNSASSKDSGWLRHLPRFAPAPRAGRPMLSCIGVRRMRRTQMSSRRRGRRCLGRSADMHQYKTWP